MRRVAVAAAALALAALAGTARSATFAVLPVGPALPPAAPSAGPEPNASIQLAPGWTLPPASPERLAYPQLQALWQRAGAAYGIPWQVLGAINKVESNFGRNMGPSSAGAIGWMQFMPSTWLRWGTDANGDGVADPWSAEDAVYSAARYLAAAGGTSDLYRAVYAYNHADWYVREVLDLARIYGQGGALAFSLDRLQVDLQRARRQVVAVNRKLVAARSLERRLARVTARWRERESRANLLSDRLAAGKQAALAGARQGAAAAAANAVATRLRSARQALDRAAAASRAASFSPAVGTLLDAPSYGGGYVFPVGGGPGSVSVGHSHHDYPAADIAAPDGAPVYALADAVVLRAWRYPDPRCGIGLTLQAFDGRVWTYCHLAYEEPSVRPGARLVAGAQVGLVGSTGDATGPHLHLQLQPPTELPQDQPWFQAFAGTAFSWQDAPTPAPAEAAAPPQPLAAQPAAPAEEPVAFELAPAPRPQQRTLASASGGAPVFAVAPAVGAVVRFTRR